MRIAVCRGAVLAALILGTIVRGQAPIQKPVDLPQLTTDQKWDRLQGNFYAMLIAGIGHAKSSGETPEQYGSFLGSTFAPSWESSRGKGALAFLWIYAANAQMFRPATFEVVEASPTLVRAKFAWGGGLEQRLGMVPRTGVTVDDVYQAFEKAHKVIAARLGLEYSETREGNAIAFTVTERKPTVTR